MTTIVPELPVSDEMREILLGKYGNSKMSIGYQMTLAYEKAQWVLADILGEQIGLPLDKMAEIYFDAVVWANQMSS
jgi:c-di-GMP-related signal transduction protein